MNKLIIFLWFMAEVLIGLPSMAQNQARQSRLSGRAEVLTLFDVTRLAKEQSIAALRASTLKENYYWRYKVYQSNYNPQLSLSGTFPGFSHTYDEVRQPDGSYDFKPVDINNSTLNLDLNQSIGASGTSVFVSSNIKRFDNFENGQGFRNSEHLYSGNPVAIGIRQPLFRYNQLRWDSKIEPLRYEESKRQFAEDMEFISIETARRFFVLLTAQISYEISTKNLANNDTIYQIGEGRYNLGKIAENELLQLELNVMTSKQQAAQAKVEMESATLRLKTFIGLNDVDSIYLILPDNIPLVVVDKEIALVEARKNRADAITFSINQLEAERGVAQAHGENGFVGDLIATYGLTNRTEGAVTELYKNPLNSQTVNLGFSIPVLDWGRQKSRLKTAEANLKLTEYTIQQDQINFDETVYTQVQQFLMLHEQVKIAERTDFVANKRFEITKNRYMIGKISITDLNLALQAKDQAKSDYIQSLSNYWNAYYTLRQLTLYDFEKNQSLYSEQE